MTKLDRRKSYYMTLDTETCNDLIDGLVYDIGLIVHDKAGNVYESRNLVVNEVFYRCSDLMQSAHYSNKLPQYYREISEGQRQVVSILRAREIVKALIKKYNIKAIISHNARFDVRSLNNTVRYMTGSRVRYFYPYGVALWDSQKMAHDTICKQKLYKRYCLDNGYMTNHNPPRPRETAEVLYRYISGNDLFDEAHTGLEDCKIEMVITCKCMRQHKKMKKELFE